MTDRSLKAFIAVLFGAALILTSNSAAVHAQEAVASPSAEAATVSYRHDVWPILKRHCWGCHSGADPQGGLSMDNVTDLAKGGESGATWVSGKPAESLLVQVLTGEVEPLMPKNKPPLAAAKIDVVRRWIAEGAPDDSAVAAAAPVPLAPDVYRHPPAVSSVAYSPDGKWLAAGCGSEAILLDAAGVLPPRRLATESELVTYVDFSPDGAVLAVAGGAPARYGEVRFFGVSDGALRSARRLGLDTLFRGGFSPDGTRLAIGASDGAICVLPVSAEGEPLNFGLHSDWVTDVTFSADGRLLISAGRDKSVKVSYADSGKLVRSIGTSADFVNSVAATPTLAISGGRDRLPASYDLQLALGDTVFNGPVNNETKPVDQSSQYTKKLEGQAGEILDIALSADRTLLAVCGATPEVRVYKVADNSRAATISGMPQPVYGVAFSPDGARLATGSYNGQVNIFELPSGKLLSTILPVPVEPSSK
jgi:WD40 repeat protein